MHPKLFESDKNSNSPFLSYRLFENASENDLIFAISFSIEDNGTNTFDEQMARIIWASLLFQSLF